MFDIRFATRRRFLEVSLSGVAAALLVGRIPAFAQEKPAGDTVPLDQLMAAQPLPDLWVGKADAPISIIEYASMTCTHCAAFHTETWPTLKSKYIETGKVRFVLREFPLDPLATAGFMLARSVGADKRNAVVDLLFDQQKNWAFVAKPLDALAATVRQAGISQAAFETVLKDQTLYEQVNKVRDQAANTFKINATPTFFINGVRKAGEMTVAELERTLDPLLKG